MPNQYNYETSVAEKLNTYRKYTVSRLVQTSSDTRVELEVPADFPDGLPSSNIEMHIYSVVENTLVASKVIKNNIDGIITTVDLQYEDDTHRQLLFIDFSKIIDIEFPLGLYSITLNFFVDEVGAYDTRSLEITEISPTRFEVELELKNTEERAKLEKFYGPTITQEWVGYIVKQLFNQEIEEELDVPASRTILTPTTIQSYYPPGSRQLFQTYGFFEDSGSKVGLNALTQQFLDEAYNYATELINRDIENGTGSFALSVLLAHMTSSLERAYTTILADERTNPTKYRYDLL